MNLLVQGRTSLLEMNMFVLYNIVVFVLLAAVFQDHSASCNKVSITSVKSIVQSIGQDIIFMWNITNGEIMEVRFGLEQDGAMSPQLVYMSDGYRPVFGSSADSRVSRYSGRLSWVGDLNTGHAWFKLTNITFQDANTYVAAVQELGTETFMTSSIVLTVKGSARFTQTPSNLLRMRAGETVKLAWNYHVISKDKEFIDISPIWSYYSSNSADPQRIAFEYRNQDSWGWFISSECPARLLNPVRVSKESRATLVISNLTTADSGVYGCSLMLKTGLPIISKVELVVTGPSIEAMIGDVETSERSKIKEVPPQSPAIVDTKATDLSIKVYWREPESYGYPVLMYSVHKVELDRPGQEVMSDTYHVNEDVHHYEVGDIEDGKRYKFYVTAWNTHGESVKDHGKSAIVKVHGP